MAPNFFWMALEVYRTEAFSRVFESLDSDEKQWIIKMLAQIKGNPRAGKPLKYNWFREKKFKDKRLYFIVYDELGKILAVAFGGKKEQQRIIDSIIRNMDAYQKLAETL